MTLPIQPWSKDKLDLLGKYLHAYTRIMRQQTWLRGCSYVDAFAGGGQFIDQDTSDYVDGSPLVALACEPAFDDYSFIERSPAKVSQLEQHAEPFRTKRQINIMRDDANTVLVRDVASTVRRQYYRRGFVFVDPYGLQVKWDTIKALAETRALDVFINFPIMAITRVLPRESTPNTLMPASLGEMFLDPGWISGLYSIQESLFGDPVAQRPRLDAHRLAEHYVQDLKQLFPHVSRPVIMKNSTSTPLYGLVLASHNETAVKVTNDIFRLYDELKRDAADSS